MRLNEKVPTPVMTGQNKQTQENESYSQTMFS